MPSAQKFSNNQMFAVAQTKNKSACSWPNFYFSPRGFGILKTPKTLDRLFANYNQQSSFSLFPQLILLQSYQVTLLPAHDFQMI